MTDEEFTVQKNDAVDEALYEYRNSSAMNIDNIMGQHFVDAAWRVVLLHEKITRLPQLEATRTTIQGFMPYMVANVLLNIGNCTRQPETLQNICEQFAKDLLEVSQKIIEQQKKNLAQSATSSQSATV